MYVIVVGGGTVGYYLSRDLVERGHEVTLIEKDGRRLNRCHFDHGGDSTAEY